MSTSTHIASYSIDSASTTKVEPKDDFARRVMERFYLMAFAKEDWRSVMQGTQNLYYVNDWEWIVAGDSFTRPVRFPTLRDFVKTLTDTFMQDPPEAMLTHRRDEDKDLVVGKQAYIEFIMSTIHEKTTRRQVVEDMFFYGLGVRAIDYFDIYQEYKGELMQTVKDVCTYRVDPRNFFVDEHANNLYSKVQMNCARDLIIRHIMPFSTFKNKFKDVSGCDISQVQPVNFYSTEGPDYVVTNAKETVEKSRTSVVKLYEYQNQETNEYGLIANGCTILKGKLSECKGTKGFSVVAYKFEPRNDSFWGNNLAQLIAPHIYLKDTLINLEIMNVKLTLQPVLAVSGDFGYNPRVHVMQPGGVWTAGGQMNGKIEDNIQPIVAGNANTRVYDMLNNINSELTITSRADLRSLEYYQGKTATEVNQQKQSMNAHNETIEALNEIEAEARMYEIINDQMVSFMDASDKKGEMRRIPIANYVVNQTEGQGLKFNQKSGAKDYFDLTEEIINVDCEIVVIDKRKDKALKYERMGRIMQFIPLVTNLAGASPEVAQAINLVGLLQEASEMLDLNQEKIFKDGNSYADEFEEIKEEILLANKVSLPKTMERKDGIAMLKFLLALDEKYELKPDQKVALRDIRQQAIELIKRPRTTPEEIAEGQVPPVDAEMSLMGAPVAGPNMAVTPGVKISQPAPGLVSPTGNKPIM